MGNYTVIREDVSGEMKERNNISVGNCEDWVRTSADTVLMND